MKQNKPPNLENKHHATDARRRELFAEIRSSQRWREVLQRTARRRSWRDLHLGLWPEPPTPRSRPHAPPRRRRSRRAVGMMLPALTGSRGCLTRGGGQAATSFLGTSAPNASLHFGETEVARSAHATAVSPFFFRPRRARSHADDRTTSSRVPRMRAWLGQLPACENSLGLRESTISWTSSREMRPPAGVVVLHNLTAHVFHHRGRVVGVCVRVVQHLGRPRGLGCAAAATHDLQVAVAKHHRESASGVHHLPYADIPERLTFRPLRTGHVFAECFRHLLPRVRPRVSRRGSRRGGSFARPRPPRGVSRMNVAMSFRMSAMGTPTSA